LWIGGAGLLTLWGRDKARAFFQGPPNQFAIKFLLIVFGLALIEEAIATLMTNCAPLFGARVGEVYISASANYLDVVVFHSVVVFLPQFAAWAWLLSRFAFSPFAVFLLFGLTGLIGETLFAGPQLLTIPQWLLVYGLMVYLPANFYPELPHRRPVRWWHYPVAVVLPILAAVPFVFLLQWLAPGHPSIHFPPIQSS